MSALLRIDILTLFPEMFAGPLSHGVLGRAQAAGLVEIAVHDIRAWTDDRHHIVDDYVYGGGSGMVMKPEPLAAAIEATHGEAGWVVLLTPQGALLNHSTAAKLACRQHLVLVCGRYEGVDERARSLFIDEEISIGDYVLTGGELPAMVLADAVARLVPGVVGKEQSLTEESHVAGLLEHPHYTRPREFRGLAVPDVLLSGDHAHIKQWRHLESLRRTLLRRPDLLDKRGISPNEREWLQAQEPEALRRLDRRQNFKDPAPRLENGPES